jgi:hypothetical protein
MQFHTLIIMFLLFDIADEICNQLNSLSKTESTSGFGIEIDCKQVMSTKTKVFKQTKHL